MDLDLRSLVVKKVVEGEPTGDALYYGVEIASGSVLLMQAVSGGGVSEYDSLDMAQEAARLRGEVVAYLTSGPVPGWMADPLAMYMAHLIAQQLGEYRVPEVVETLEQADDGDDLELGVEGDGRWARTVQALAPWADRGADLGVQIQGWLRAQKWLDGSAPVQWTRVLNQKLRSWRRSNKG